MPSEIKLLNAPFPKEFSAMTWKGSDTLFIFAQRDTDHFYFTTRIELERAVVKTMPIALNSMKVTGLGHFASEHINEYDGIEACVIIGNKVFLSVEGKADKCFILKGRIVDSTVVFNRQDFIELNIPPGFPPNYGYESLFNIGDSLIAMFELYRSNRRNLGCSIDTGLNRPAPGVQVIYPNSNRRSLQRITDVCKYDDTTYYAIDFLLRSNKTRKSQPCYSNLVKLKIIGNRIDVHQVTALNYLPIDCKGRRQNCINFEGMVRFKDGLLLISDDYISDDSCTHLYYYRFNSR
jgi:hypothetical protein